VFDAAEINSSFHRPHRRETYGRWATAVPTGFRFAAKAPRAITHDLRLVGAQAPLQRFLDEVEGLGESLGPLLVQLPPSLAFDERIVASFFEDLRDRFAGAVVCEPRHSTWFSPHVEGLLAGLRVGIVAADPPRGRSGLEPAAWPGIAYFRLHGAPRTYWSSYPPQTLAVLADRLLAETAPEIWCVFDNTASGAAAANALELRAILEAGTFRTRKVL
jgi:uncharacterized protein YecE (DUF72 family)